MSYVVTLHAAALIPLCENMTGGKATKPGSVLTAHNGKSILVERTDRQGMVALADTLSYSEVFNPCLLIDVATLTCEYQFTAKYIYR